MRLVQQDLIHTSYYSFSRSMAPAMQRTGHSMAPAIEPTLFDRARAQCNGARARKMMSATLRPRAQ
jgi:hypothetical protein